MAINFQKLYNNANERAIHFEKLYIKTLAEFDIYKQQQREKAKKDKSQMVDFETEDFDFEPFDFESFE